MERLFFPVTEKEAKRDGIPYSSATNKNALFPSRLRELRKEKDVSQDVLSKVLLVSKSTVGLWETGDTLPDAKSLFKLANYYGVSADYLLGLSDAKSPDRNLQSICEYTGLSEAALLVIRFIKLRGETITQQILSMILESKDFSEVLDKFTTACNLELDSDLGTDEKIKEFNKVYEQELKQIGGIVYGAGPTSDMFLYNASNGFMKCMQQIRLKWKEAHNHG